MDYIIRTVDKMYAYHMLWIGIIIYNIGLLILDHTMQFSFVVMLFLYLGVIVSGASVLMCLNFDKKSYSGYGKFTGLVVVLIFVWSFFMVINSGMDKVVQLNQYIYPYKILPYTIIIMLLVKFEGYLLSFIAIFDKMLIISLISLAFSIPNGNNFIQITFETFSIGAAFLFMTNKYHNRKVLVRAIIVLVVSFIVVTIMGRRNLMFTTGLYILFGGICLFKDGKIKSIESKIVLVFTTLLLLVVFAFYFASSSAFDTIKGRATENTRETVFMMFFIDMADPKDIALGRGVFGEYYCPGVDRSSDTDEYNDDREVIECGYLQLILKGGVVYLCLYMILTVVAVFRGFKAKNRFVNVCAYIVLVQLIDMFPFGLHSYNTKAFLIWLCVGICFNKRLAGMSEDEIFDMLYKKKKQYLPWETK